jgi:hypothetical protein
MNQLKNNLIVCIILVQFFSLLSSSEFSQICDNNVHAQISDNTYQSSHSKDHCFVYVTIEKPKSFSVPTSHVIAKYGSARLKNYLATVITPMIRAVTMDNYYCALAGYASPHGLRDCLAKSSQFVRSDERVIEKLNIRIESYCTRIDEVLFDKQGMFCQELSFDKQVALAKIYAEFLQEFYCSHAKAIFEKNVHNSSTKQVLNTFKWDKTSYDGNNYCSSHRQIEQRYAESVNGNLGAVYVALHLGDIEKANTIGQKRIKTEFSGKLWGKTEKVTSVFENYPDLKKVVEQRSLAEKAKMEQERVAKQNALQQQVTEWQEKYKVYNNNYEKFPVPYDTLLQRHRAADRDVIVTFSKKIHKVSPEKATHIHPTLLSANKKEILFDGCHLQHQLVDEAISVIDTAISCDLVENIQDAVIDLANASLMSNKAGDIVTTSYTLDTCWAIIDFGKKAAHYTYATGIAVTEGIIEGAVEALCGAVNTVCHPVKAAQEVANSFVTAGYCLGKLTYKIAEHAAICDMMEINSEHAEQMIREHSCDSSVFFAVYEAAKDVSAQDIARVGTKTVADMMLLHGATKVISSITKTALPMFVNAMRKGAQSTEVAVTAEGIPVRCAEEIASLMNDIEKVGGSSEIIAAAVEVANEAYELLRTFNISKYDASIGNLKKLEQAIERFKNIPGALTKDGALFKALEYGQKAEVLTDAKKILEIKGRLTTARGAMYEVEKALELMEAGENILYLGEKIALPNVLKGLPNVGYRDFDITTATKLIECKNINWPEWVGPRSDRIRGNLIGQLTIAQNKGKIFEFYSKQMIPDQWKSWLMKNGIKFFEEYL